MQFLKKMELFWVHVTMSPDLMYPTGSKEDRHTVIRRQTQMQQAHIFLRSLENDAL